MGEERNAASSAHADQETDLLVRHGIRLNAEGHRPQALAFLEKAVQQNPEHAVGLLHLALALSADDRNEESESYLNRALRLDPQNPAFHLFAGRIYFDALDHVRARNEFRRALELSPENDLAQGYSLLNEWAASGAGDAAMKLVPLRLPDSSPFLARLLMLIELTMRGRQAEFIDERVVVQHLDRPRVAYMLWRGANEQKAGRFDRAMAYAHSITEMHPGHPAAVAMLRECQAAALGAAERRAAESPNSAEARLDLAAHFCEADRYEEAQTQVDEAAKIAAAAGVADVLNEPANLRLQGRVLFGLGRISEAIERLTAGAEPGFSMAETNYFLGLCYAAAGDRCRCTAEFEKLVNRMYWAVPLRLRECQAQLAQKPPAPPEPESAPQT